MFIIHIIKHRDLSRYYRYYHKLSWTLKDERDVMSIGGQNRLKYTLIVQNLNSLTNCQAPEMIA